MTNNDSSTKANVRSVARALDILELLGSRPKLSLAEVARFLRLPRSSAHALLTTLTARGYVSYSDIERAYSIGIRSWELGQQYRVYDSLISQAIPAMEALVDQLDEICQLAVLDGREVVYLHKVDSQQPIQLISRRGERLHAHASGLGKALLSGVGDPEIDQLFGKDGLPELTPNTITDLPTLKRELAEVRRTGIAYDREEFVIGLRCVATPILGSSGKPIAAMSLSLPTMRYTEMWRKRAAPMLKDTARSVSSRLGARSE